jgi:hypothetical protein
MKGMKYHSISLTGGGYTFDLPTFVADNFFLMNGLTDNHATGTNLFKNVLSVDADQQFSVLGTGALRLQGGLDTNGHLLTLTVMQPAANPLLTVDSVTGGGNILKNGGGGMVLGGTSANTSGIFCLLGQLQISKPPGVNAMGSGGTLLIGHPVALTTLATVTMTQPNQLPDNATVDIGENGRWEVRHPETIQTFRGRAGELSIDGTLTITDSVPMNFTQSTFAPTQHFRINGSGTLVRTQPRLWKVNSGATLSITDSGIQLQAPSGVPAEILGPGRTNLSASFNFPDGLSIGTATGSATERLALVRMSGDHSNTPIILNGGTLEGYPFIGEIRGTPLGGRLIPDEIDEPGVGIRATAMLLNASGQPAVLQSRAYPDYPDTFKSTFIQSGGIVNLSNARIELEFRPGPTPNGPNPPSVGQKYMIISKTSAGVVTQTIPGLPEGAIFNLGAARFQITYAGGDGNDVVLTSQGMPDFKVNSLTVNPQQQGGSGKVVAINATGLPGARHRLMVSEDLQTWTLLATLTADLNGIVSATVPDVGATGPKRFYRLEL